MATRKDKRGRVLEKGEYQRKDGTYSYSYTDFAGKRHSLYAPDLAKLREKERDLKISVWQGIEVERGNTLTLNETFDRYLQTKFGLKESTVASYNDMYDRYVRDEFGMQLIKNIRHSDVQSFYTYLLKKRGIGIRSVEYVQQMLNPAFDLAIQDSIILKNPTKGVLAKIKKANGYSRVKRHALTMDQQRAFLNYIDGHPNWARYHSIFQVMLGTGLRCGEFVGLRWQDVDFERKIISVNHQIVNVKGKKGKRPSYLHVSLPKSEAGIRNIPIMDPVMEAFKEEYRYEAARGFPNTVVEGYTDFIFTKQNGTVYTCNRLDKVLSDITESYNRQEIALSKEENRDPLLLPHFSCHILRHTFCTRLCERDVNIKVIQTVMGHANINITMDIYAEVSEKKQREAIEKMATELDVF